MSRMRAASVALFVGAALAPFAPIASRADAAMIVRPLHVTSPIPTAPGDVLQYYGGRLISNVEIVAVFWTTGVDSTLQAQIGSFYTAIVKSPYIDWLQEYDTLGKVGLIDGMPGSNQHIGRGTFAGAHTITPTHTGTSLTDDQISAELVAQIQGGHLPKPTLDAKGNVDTLYMIDFPPGTSISVLGLQSCVSGGFGAYHFTVVIDGKSVPYGVHPDCGYSFDQATLIHSHELIEAITDTEVGLAAQNAPTTRPIAWATIDDSAFDSQEIADICETMNDRADIVAGFTVQKVWSNYAAACVATIPICDGVLQKPACRACTNFDSGSACEGATPACALAGSKVGRCVACTSAATSACTGATPVCDDAKNACVGCMKNGDCKTPATPVCETASETCRACKSDAECVVGTVCDITNDAHKGACVACNVDADCPGQKCDLTAHACTPLGAAGGNADAGAAANGDAPSADSGCGCSSAGSASDGMAMGAFGIAIAALVRRRRARR